MKLISILLLYYYLFLIGLASTFVWFYLLRILVYIRLSSSEVHPTFFVSPLVAFGLPGASPLLREFTLLSCSALRGYLLLQHLLESRGKSYYYFSFFFYFLLSSTGVIIFTKTLFFKKTLHWNLELKFFLTIRWCGYPSKDFL